MCRTLQQRSSCRQAIWTILRIACMNYIGYQYLKESSSMFSLWFIMQWLVKHLCISWICFDPYLSELIGMVRIISLQYLLPARKPVLIDLSVCWDQNSGTIYWLLTFVIARIQNVSKQTLRLFCSTLHTIRCQCTVSVLTCLFDCILSCVQRLWKSLEAVGCAM